MNIPIVVAFVLTVSLAPAYAQPEGKHPMTPIETLLDADGTLNTATGFEGSIDPRGYRMVAGEDGRPRFLPAASPKDLFVSDAHWDSAFTVPYLNGRVKALAVSGTDLYAGGDFTSAAGVTVNSIARWDGTRWWPLGSGMNNTVNAIAVAGSDVYAGGSFTAAGGLGANRIAKWNGTSWSALGSGMNAGVHAITLSGDTVYAGGDFTTAGGVSAEYIAQWHGGSWSAMGSGMNGAVKALVAGAGRVYAGGYFTSAGGISAAYVASWDGTGWTAIGGGMDNAVLALVAQGSSVFAGGRFHHAGGVAANGVAKWDGGAWSALGGGMYPEVDALVVAGGDLVAAGTFLSADGLSAMHIARWNGVGWAALGGGMDFDVHALATAGDDLYAGGVFTQAGTVAAKCIAKWSASSWSALGSGSGLDNYITAVHASGANVYAAGGFSAGGTLPLGRVGRWDGTAWTALGAGMTDRISPVNALATIGGTLYLGGDIVSIGPTPVDNLVQWDGTSWSEVGGGVGWFGSDMVYALAADGPNLYVGGAFGNAGALWTATNIAKWSGSGWSALGSGLDGPVYALAVSGGNLYAGGAFTTAGGVSANYIARWDGSSWSALGAGMDAPVSALAVSGGIVYAGGDFTTAGGVGAAHIAKWDGVAWAPMGSGTDGRVGALAASGSSVYAGGEFLSAGGVNANYIARWNGDQWSALGSGMNDAVRSLAVVGSDVYAGGYFTEAGGIPSRFMARWHESSHTITATSGPNGAINPSGVVVVVRGEDQSFDFLPAPHYHVDSVFVDGIFIGSPAAVTFDSVLDEHTVRTVFRIDAYSIMASAGPNGSISPAGVSTVTYGGNRLFVMLPDSGYGVDRVVVDSADAGSGMAYNFTNVQGNHTIEVYFTNTTTVPVSVGERWSLVSVPVIAPVYEKDSLFPTSVTPAFSYLGGYAAATVLRNGAGYWLKFSAPVTVELDGGVLSRDTIEVTQGWNLIGSITAPLAVSQIGTIPGGMVSSRFFAYGGSYVEADTIEPGRGYWVKLSGNGKLVLLSSANVPVAERIRVVPSEELPPPPPADTSSQPARATPEEFLLTRNYPNPFNPATRISFELPLASVITLAVFNTLGQEVSRPVDGRWMAAGRYSAEFNASGLPSGVYYYRISAVAAGGPQVRTFTGTGRMLFLR